jgi:hypothetical protein
VAREIARPDVKTILGSEDEPNSVLFILFIPSKDKDGNDLDDHEVWAANGAELLTRLFGGATRMPVASGHWLNEETDEIITEDVALVHSYARMSDAANEGKLKALAVFLHNMGKTTKQGEVAVLIEDVFHRIRRFTLADRGAK